MKPLVTPTIEKLSPYRAGTPVEQIAASHGFDPAEIVKLASNENPRGAGAAARQAAQAAAAQLGRYPDPAAPELCAALATQLGVSSEEIVLGNGSNELLQLFVRTFCTTTGHVVFGDPAFVVYRMACLAQGIPYTAVPLRGWVHDLPAMADAITADTQLVFIANPNNPTGTYVDRVALREFLGRVPPHVVVVLDEAYIEYVGAEDYPNGLDHRSLHPQLVLARTFSKIHGLASLRVGYAILPPQLADYVHRVRDPFNVNSVAQAAALAALADREHVESSRTLNLEEKKFVSSELEALGVEVVPSEGNFLLVNTGQNGTELYNSLLKHGVIVRPIPPLPNALRITLGTRAENERCLAALKAELS